MKFMFCSKFFYSFLNICHSLRPISHSFCWKIKMTSWSCPTCEKFWCKRNGNIKILGNSSKDISRHPKLITTRNTKTWTYLVLPLAWHNLWVSSRYLDTSIQTSFVMQVRDYSTESFGMTDGTVVWSLFTWITIIRPA
jgi:hypothetical protein